MGFSQRHGLEVLTLLSRRSLTRLLLLTLLLGTASSFVPRLIHATNSALIVAPAVIDLSLGPGSVTTFAVNVSNVGPSPETLYDWQLFLQMNPNLLKITQVIEGPALSNIANALGGYTLFTGIFNSTTGLVKTDDLLALPPGHVNEGLVGSGTLVYVKVQVLAYGTTNLVLNNTELIESCCPIVGIAHTVIDGVFSNVPYDIPPTPSFTMSPEPASILAGSPVHFDASASSDRDGTIVKYMWQFGDGNVTSVTVPMIDHTYNSPGGPFRVFLNVTDNGGATASANMTFFVSRALPPRPTAVFTFSPVNPRVGEQVTFDGTSSTVAPGDSFDSRQPCIWSFGDGITGGGVIIHHTFHVAGYYSVTLYVRDVHNLTGNTTKTVKVTEVSLPTLKVSTFFTDTRLKPLPTDAFGNPKVVAILADGVVASTEPRQVLVWVNITNTSGSPLQSLTMNETLPFDWTIHHAWNPSLGGVHVYFTSAAGLVRILDITQRSTITVSTGIPPIAQEVDLAIPSFNLTRIGHPLMPGQTILVTVELTYSLDRTCQPAQNYPRNYYSTAMATGRTGTSFQGTLSTNTTFAFFTAYASMTSHKVDPDLLSLSNYDRYTKNCLRPTVIGVLG